MSAIWMDVDAALSEVPVNLVALIDDTDFKSREESVTYDQAGMDLVWNFVTTAGAYTQTAVTPTTAGVYDWTNQGNGMYSIEIPASGGGSINNDTEGFGWFTGFATGILPWTGPVIGFRVAGLNNLLIDDAFSATRGLTGTAVPAVAADGVGGLPISDAGGLDMDALAANAARLTAARAGVLTDWIDGGRLDLLLDAIPTAMANADLQRIAQQVAGRTVRYFDANNGNDSNTGTAQGDAYQTLGAGVTAATTAAAAGDVGELWILADGEYDLANQVVNFKSAVVNEIQEVSIVGTPVSGNFTLSYDGQTTGSIAYNASAATVDSALEALSNIGAGDVTCTGGPLPGTAVDVEFTGALADTQVAMMTATDVDLSTGVAAVRTVVQGAGLRNIGIRGGSAKGTVITNSNAVSVSDTLTLSDGCTIDRCTVRCTSPASVALVVANTEHVTIKRCLIDGKFDGLLATRADYLTSRDTVIKGTYDGANIDGCRWLDFENVYFYTDCSHASAVDKRAVKALANGGVAPEGIMRNCFLEADRSNNQAGDTFGIVMDDGKILLDNVIVAANSSHGSYAADVSGAKVTGGKLLMRGGQVTTSSAGGGNVYDLNQTGGTLAVDGTVNYDTSKTNGTITRTNEFLNYDGGAIWIDTNASNTNTVSFIDGTAENPVSTLAAATTIAGNVNIKKFHLVPGSNITLAQAYDDYIFDACHSTIALGGQSINNAVFMGAVITGNDDGSNANQVQYFDCVIGTNTLGQFVMTRCYFTATLTLAQAGSYFMHQCFSGVAGTSTPTLDFGVALNASNVSMRDYSGGIEIENMGTGTGSYNMSLEGFGQLIINANCSATSTVAIRGHFTVTDNAGGAVTLSDDARFDTPAVKTALEAGGSTLAQILADTGELQTDDVPGLIATAQVILDNLPNSGALTDIGTATARLTAVRAAVLTDWINGGRLDLILDIIAADTTTDIPALIAALNNLSAANVNAEVVDVLRTDTVAELAAIPAASPGLHAMVQLIYMAERNKLTSTGTASTVSNDAGAAIGTSIDSDDATTFTRGKLS